VRDDRSMARASPPGFRGVAVATGLVVVLAAATGSTLCPVAALTGTACPGCGLTRATLAVARGDLAAMWRWHPLAPAVLAYGLAAVAHWARDRARWATGRAAAVHATALGVLALGLVAVWLVRLAGGTLPPV
jgi:hypothetical protein